MPKIHLYVTPEVFLPKLWRDAAGLKAGTGVKLAMTAYAKGDLAPLLEDRGWSGRAAESAAASMLTQQRVPEGLLLLHEADQRLFPLPAEDVAAWFWTGADDKDKIFRVTLDDTAIYGYVIHAIARFRRVDGQTYAEPLNVEAGTCPACDSADVATFDPAPPSTDPTHHVCQDCGRDYTR